MKQNTPPPGWALSSLEQVVDILDSRRVPVNSRERDKRPGTVPYYGATGQVGWIDDYLFDEELVLLGEDGAPFLDGSRAKAYLIRGRSWVNNHAHVLRARSGISNAFLAHQLNRIDYHPFVSGTTRLKLPQAPMRGIPMLIAPPSEQARIVDAIETQLTRLDAAIAALERVRANLKRYRASVLKAAVEGRLVPTEAELARREGRDYEPASVLLQRILAERRRRWEEAELAAMQAKGKAPKDDKWKAKYEEPVAPDTAGLPELPAGWCWASVDQICENHDRARVPLKSKDRALRRGSYPYYGASGIIDQIDDYLFDGEFLLIGEDGANLLARSTPIAFKANGKFWVNNHAHVLLPLSGVPIGYVETFVNSVNLAPYVTGTAQPKLTQANLNRLAVPLPPSAEAVRIVCEADGHHSVVDSLTASLLLRIRRIPRLRQSILKCAFEGRLVEQDPNDEPASVLLERIRAERGARGAAPAARRRARSARPRPPEEAEAC